jgi:hypothetical protein
VKSGKLRAFLDRIKSRLGLPRLNARDSAELFPRAFWSFAREFSSRKAASCGYGRAALILDTVLPAYSSDRAIRFSQAVALRRTGPRVPVVGWRPAVGDHVAASIDGHVSQAADRLAVLASVTVDRSPSSA